MEASVYIPTADMSSPASPSSSVPINGANSNSRQRYGGHFAPLSGSMIAASPLAHESIARDIASESEDGEVSDSDSEAPTVLFAPEHALSGSYRRPSFVAYGTRSAIAPQHIEVDHIPRPERERAEREAESLLRDNHLEPPKHPHDGHETITERIYKAVFSTKQPTKQDQHEAEQGHIHASPEPTETTGLLSHDSSPPESVREAHERRNRIWEQAVREGKIKTTWQREALTLAQYSAPLVVTFVLQYSLTVASIFTVGHLGTIELGAVSLASMTANITGYAIYQGLATALDTLCAQAYGSGRKHLVGLQLQRMVLLLWLLSVPISLIWFFSPILLRHIIPNPESAELAGLYLRVLILGIPGYSLFEAGKRFVQAQGLFQANMYVLLVAAPLNAFMNWLFVWKFNWGFIGAPLAVALTDNLLPVFLFLYVYYIDGRQCWGGFTKRALHNWSPMVQLALPGLVMVEAEFLAFEILTLASAYFGTTALGANSVISTVTAITFQFPFPISIAASTRVANLIGATLSDAAKTSAKVAAVAACCVGLMNAALLFLGRNWIPTLFTNDLEVIALVAHVLPVCAMFQWFDAFAALANGLLRGLGRQEIGGYVNLACYYIVAMPISFGTAFGGGWELRGLWTGVAIALGLVAAIEGSFLARTSWDAAVVAARERNVRA